MSQPAFRERAVCARTAGGRYTGLVLPFDCCAHPVEWHSSARAVLTSTQYASDSPSGSTRAGRGGSRGGASCGHAAQHCERQARSHTFRRQRVNRTTSGVQVGFPWFTPPCLFTPWSIRSAKRSHCDAIPKRNCRSWLGQLAWRTLTVNIGCGA